MNYIVFWSRSLCAAVYSFIFTFRLSYDRCVCLHGPTLIELIKHDIPLEQNNTELIKIQLNPSECSSSPSAQSFESEAVMRGFEHTFPDLKHFLPLKTFKIKAY